MSQSRSFLLDRPEGPADPLTSVLSTLRLSGALYCCSELSAPWGIRFGARECAAFHVVDRGSCWLRLPGETPLALRGGDLVMLPHGDEHVLSDSPTGPAKDVDFRDHPGVCGPLVRWGGGGAKTVLVCGELQVDEVEMHPLRAHLPRLMHLRGDEGAGSGWLEGTLKLLATEASAARPGAYAVVTRLIDVLFVQAIRAWLEQQQGLGRGWVAGLKDPPVAAALALMHSEPAAEWTVATLAARVGLSRSVFAERFTQVVGEPPLSYLTRWRMHLSASLLKRNPALSVAQVAERVGYDSEAAFNRAFKRTVGRTPGQVRREAERVAA